MIGRTFWLVSALLLAACSKPKQEAAKQDPTTAGAAVGSGGVAGSADSPGSAGSAGSGAGTDVGSGSAALEPTATGSAGSAAPGAADPASGENYLALAAGAVLVAQPASDRAFDNRPINVVFDGQMWRSDESKVAAQVFVIETPGVTTLTTLGFDTHHMFHTPEENAKSVVVEASNTSATAGFQPILATTLPAEPAITNLPVTATVPGRWFRLTVESNHGSTSAVALKRIFGYGSQVPGALPTQLSGTFRDVDPATDKPSDRNYNDIFLKQDSTAVVGCDRAKGTITGGLQGNVATVVWTHPDLGKNSGLIVASQQDRIVFWRLNADSFWALDTYQRVGSELGPCGDGSSLTKPAGIAKDLADTGRAVVYGINFDFNSDRLRPESKVVLEEIVTVLKANPTWKMQIEGHTDSVGSAEFNQPLSEKRAAAVVAYLAQHEIAADRLSASGVGLARPIASNDSGVGRARNRRVELVKQ